MIIEEVPHLGWPRNLRISNNEVQLIITLEVGPRIISYRTSQGSNVLKTFEEHLGGSGEELWKIRGGHRHWIAPEDLERTYALDNAPYPYALNGETFHATNPGVGPWFLKKETSVTLASAGSGVTVTHTVTNESDAIWKVAPWALTVMAAGGTCILPQPTPGEHPHALLPNRALVIWPYADLTDPRLHLGRHFITLEQRADLLPLKIGLAHRSGWAAYLLDDQLFVKTVPWTEGAEYPDLGCNFETFTDADMLEVETLGTLSALQPGQSSTHTETWLLHSGLTPPAIADSEAFLEWLQPYLP